MVVEIYGLLISVSVDRGARLFHAATALRISKEPSVGPTFGLKAFTKRKCVAPDDSKEDSSIVQALKHCTTWDIAPRMSDTPKKYHTYYNNLHPKSWNVNFL